MSNPCHEWNELARSSREAKDSGERWRDIVVKYLECYAGIAGELKQHPDRADTRAEELIRFAVSYGFEVRNDDFQSMIRKTGQQMLALAKRYEKPVARTPVRQVDRKADPVIMWSGELVYEVQDLHLRGAGLDFTFVRTYKNQANYQGPCGHRWDHSYNVWLRVSNDEAVLSMGDLSTRSYLRHQRFDDTGFDYWVPPDGTDAILMEEGEDFVVRRPDGTCLHFELDPFTQSFIYRLVRIADRHGNDLRLEHVEHGVKRIFVNGPNRLVVFDYDDAGRVISLSDHSGRSWCYNYDDFGDLSVVVTPTGSKVLYEYSSSSARIERQHLLTRVTDPCGRNHLEVAYGSGTFDDDKVVRQRQGGGEFLFAYEDLFGDPQATEVAGMDVDGHNLPIRATTLVGRGGQEQRHIYNAAGNLLMTEENAVIGGQMRHLIAHYRYDADGSLTASRSPEGVMTQYLYGREAFLRRHGLADADSPEAMAHLDRQTRQGFGRLLASVERAHPPTSGFPDLFASHPDDIIEKLTYEAEFGQVSSVSDPRFTSSADPDAIEDPLHEATLTRWIYEGSDVLLSEVRYPTAEHPDGIPADPVIERMHAYDNRGRVLRNQDASGLQTETVRFGPADGSREGLIKELIIDPGGLAVTTRYELDELGRVVAIIRPRGVESSDGRFVERFEFDGLDRIIQTIASAPFSFNTRNIYDTSGMLAREERDALDTEGVPFVGAPAVRTWMYNEDLLLTRETLGGADPDGRAVTHHRYDAFGARAITIHPAGNSTRYRYNARGLPSTQTHGYGTPDAAYRSCDYDGDGRIFRSRDARGHATLTTYDAFGRAVATENPLGHVVRHTFSKTGQMLVERVFERRSSGYVLAARSERRYDALDRLNVEITNRFETPPVATDLEHDFNTGPGPGEQIVWHTFYEPGGRVVRRAEVNRGVAVQFEHDRLGRIKAEIDAAGSRTEYRYDLHGNVVRGDRFEGTRVFSWEMSYDELDRMVSHGDALGNTTHFQYDSLDRRMRVTDPLGNVREAHYNLRGDLEAEIHQRTLTGLGSGVGLQPITTRYEHDASGNLTAVLDPLGRRTEFSYDSLDRRVATIDAAGARTEFTHDADGHLLRTVSPSGRELVREIDPNGRILRVEAVGVPALGPRVEMFAYDALGRTVLEENDHLRAEIRRDSLGQAVEERMIWNLADAGQVQSLLLKRRFDTANRLIELDYPNGRRIRYDRNASGRISAVTNVSAGAHYPGAPNLSNPRPLVAQVEGPGLRRDVLHFANGALCAIRYDGAGRIIEIDHSGPAGALLTLQYLCDGAANLRWVNELIGSDRRGRLYRYDSQGQLVHTEPRADLPVLGVDVDVASFAPATARPTTPLPERQNHIDTVLGPLALVPGVEDFRYDAAGNRVEERRGNDTIRYDVNELDEYTAVDGQILEYDSDGNLIRLGTRRFMYDAWGRLIAVDEPSRPSLHFFYDARGRRIARSQGAATQVLVYDDDRLIEERAGDTLVAQWVNDDGLDHPLQLATDGEDLYYHADLQGSIRLLSNGEGVARARYNYSPFGVPEAHTSIPYNPLRYAARVFDETIDSYDFRARQYEPRIGRFLQRDPVESYENPYAYAGNSPLSFNDPVGTTRKEVVSGDAAANSPPAISSADKSVVSPPAAPPAEPPKPPAPPVNVVQRGIMTDDEIAVIRDQVRSYDDAITRLQIQDRELVKRLPELEKSIFEAERWVWPNYGTAATVIDWGEKVAGCYIGKYACAAEIGSGIVGMFHDDAGKVIGYANAAAHGKKAVASELATDAGAWGFRRLHQQSERRKKAKGNVLRDKLNVVGLESERIKTQIESLRRLQTDLKQKLIDDQKIIWSVKQYPDGSFGL